MLSKAVDHLQTREEQLQPSEAQEESSGGDSLLHIALLSTVVFHGAWQKQFLFTETQNLPFTLSDGSTVKVPMMYQSTEVNFGKGRNKTDTNQRTFPCGVLMDYNSGPAWTTQMGPSNICPSPPHVCLAW